MHRFVEEIVSIAEASLGGLRGRSALLVGPEEQRQPYRVLLHQAGMKYIYQEDTQLLCPCNHTSRAITHESSCKFNSLTSNSSTYCFSYCSGMYRASLSTAHL